MKQSKGYFDDFDHDGDEHDDHGCLPPERLDEEEGDADEGQDHERDVEVVAYA